MSLPESWKLADQVLDRVGTAVVGKRYELSLVLAGILAGGHVLLEDLPGLGKTLTARCFAQSLGLDFRRLQFTPDLLPADVTGSFLYDQRKGDFAFRAGPVAAAELVEGAAEWEIRWTRPGRHVVAVRYDGSRNLAPSASDPLVLAVEPRPDAEMDDTHDAGVSDGPDGEGPDGDGLDAEGLNTQVSDAAPREALEDRAAIDASFDPFEDGPTNEGASTDRAASTDVAGADGSIPDAVGAGGGGCACRTGARPPASRESGVAFLVAVVVLAKRRKRRDDQGRLRHTGLCKGRGIFQNAAPRSP